MEVEFYRHLPFYFLLFNHPAFFRCLLFTQLVSLAFLEANAAFLKELFHRSIRVLVLPYFQFFAPFISSALLSASFQVPFIVAPSVVH